MFFQLPFSNEKNWASAQNTIPFIYNRLFCLALQRRRTWSPTRWHPTSCSPQRATKATVATSKQRRNGGESIVFHANCWLLSLLTQFGTALPSIVDARIQNPISGVLHAALLVRRFGSERKYMHWRKSSWVFSTLRTNKEEEWQDLGDGELFVALLLSLFKDRRNLLNPLRSARRLSLSLLLISL